MEETKKLIDKCLEIRDGALSKSVLERAKYLVLDYIGVAARGSVAESSRIVRNMISRLDMGVGTAVLIGTDAKASPPYAAMANGTAAHSLELDDVSREASLHPGVSIISSALAATYFGECTGKRFIEGIVTGYEVAIRLGACLDPEAHYAQGFHPTGTCGTMGAAIASGTILNLGKGHMLNALGIAGSQAAGSMEFLSNGSFTKRLHAGWAAHSGLVAALLAREGFTGPETIVEGRHGFLNSYSSRPRLDKVFEKWGSPLKIMEVSIKPHSCCRYKQAPIDGILEIMKKNRLAAYDIEHVQLGILKAGFDIVASPEDLKQNPRTVVDAQFSMPFGAAVAILYGKASLDEYSETRINSPDVKSMMSRIKCVRDDTLDKDFPRKWPASIDIFSKSRKRHSTRIEYAKGDPENPLSWDELIDKFRTLTEGIYTAEKGNTIIDTVREMDRKENQMRLSELLAK